MGKMFFAAMVAALLAFSLGSCSDGDDGGSSGGGAATTTAASGGSGTGGGTATVTTTELSGKTYLYWVTIDCWTKVEFAASGNSATVTYCTDTGTSSYDDFTYEMNGTSVKLKLYDLVYNLTYDRASDSLCWLEYGFNDEGATLERLRS